MCGYTTTQLVQDTTEAWTCLGITFGFKKYTAFLIMARRLAPGVIAPARRRRPSKGAYGINDSES